MNAAEALKQYGYVGSLAESVPELKKIFLSMAAKNANVDEFTRAVQDSKWWKNSADRDKQNQILKATKPGEYNLQRSQAIDKVRLIAQKLGVNPGSHINQYAASIMRFGWDDAELERHLASLINPKAPQVRNGSSLGGDLGSVQQQVRQTYANYGIAYTPTGVINRTRQIIMGQIDLTHVQAEAINAAKSKYAAYAQEIDQGRTVQDIASPYISAMAQTLELPDGTLTLSDPHIQRALTARDPKGQPTATPLWAFQDQLRNDPRYDHTDQAVNGTYSMLSEIGKGFGFSA